MTLMEHDIAEDWAAGEPYKKKRALITGITGQDGSYLAELLLSKGYEVAGIVRRVAVEEEKHRLSRILHLYDSIILFDASLESYPSLCRAINEFKPDECYHLAAQSFIGYSFEDEFSTINTNLSGTHFMLSAIRDFAPECKFYFAATSEMFGNAKDSPQNEDTPFDPRSSYGISKLAGYHLTKNYRDAHGLYAMGGILFNHESPRRGAEFVTRKVTRAVANIKLGRSGCVHLGNLDARRDWGYAPEYVEAMYRMMQQDIPEDYVIATGETHSVRELTEVAFGSVGLEASTHVVVDESLVRPSDIYELKGDAEKARTGLGWEPQMPFETMIADMVKKDMDAIQSIDESMGENPVLF